MRYSKRYIVLTVILLVTFLAKLNTWNDEYADVTAFRGAKLQDEVFIRSRRAASMRRAICT